MLKANARLQQLKEMLEAALSAWMFNGRWFQTFSMSDRIRALLTAF
jgi:hypothetical protein